VTSTELRAGTAEDAVARALWAALRTFAWIPGSRVVEASDVAFVLTDTPYANFNNLIETSVAADGVDGADTDSRLREILLAVPRASLPVTWWAGPTTRPVDLTARLQRLGLARQEPEFGMVLDMATGWPDAPLRNGATLETVDRPDQLDEWLEIMNAAYGWPDARKTAIVRTLYLDDLARPTPDRSIHHYLVRAGGTAVACSSLFVEGGEAFVTNIGTRPDARGFGYGTAATVATLELARALDRPLATLTASIDGRGVYRRLGFRDAGVMERYVATPESVRRLTDDGRRSRRP
jgi:ribosomal protein S18 acetylase RimI-like enzyme